MWKFSEVVPRQQNTNQSEAQLKQALALAQEIKNPESRSEALSSIAGAYGELGDSKAALKTLKDSLNVAQQIENSAFRSEALRDIAAAAGELTNPNMRQSILEDTLAVAEADHAGEALAEISYQYALHDAWGKALHALRRCLDAEKVPALAKILTLWAKKENPQ